MKHFSLILIIISIVCVSCSKDGVTTDYKSNQYLYSIVANTDEATKVSLNGENGKKLYWEEGDKIYVTSTLVPSGHYHEYVLIGEGGTTKGTFEIVNPDDPIEIIPGDSYFAYYGTENAQIAHSGTTKFLNLPYIPTVQDYVPSGYVSSYLNMTGVSNTPGEVNFENNSSVFRVKLTSDEDLTVKKVSLIGATSLTGQAYFQATSAVVSSIYYSTNSSAKASVLLSDSEGDLSSGDIDINLVVYAGTQPKLTLVITLDNDKVIYYRKSSGKTFARNTIYDFGSLALSAEDAVDPVVVSTDTQSSVIIDELSSFSESIIFESGKVTIDDINSALGHYIGTTNLDVSFGNTAVFDGGNKWPSCDVFNSIYKTKMTSIQLPNNVTELTGMEVRPSFWSARMTAIKEIAFPGLQSIRANSICMGENGRVKVTIPATLTSISAPITGVSNFVSLNTNFVVGSDGALYNTGNQLIALPSTFTEYTFGTGVGMVDRNCLDGSAITTVVFNDRSTFGVGAVNVPNLNTIVYTTNDYPIPSFGRQVMSVNVGLGGTIYIPSTADRSQYEKYLAYLIDEARGSKKWVIDDTKTFAELYATYATVTPLTIDHE